MTYYLFEDVAKLNSKEWYFFSFRDRKYATGFRTNRATTSGYWKATGKDRAVLDPRTKGVIGMRKTLVFYKNRAPNGTKTGWIMHEFRLENPHVPPKVGSLICAYLSLHCVDLVTKGNKDCVWSYVKKEISSHFDLRCQSCCMKLERNSFEIITSKILFYAFSSCGLAPTHTHIISENFIISKISY